MDDPYFTDKLASVETLDELAGFAEQTASQGCTVEQAQRIARRKAELMKLEAADNRQGAKAAR